MTAWRRHDAAAMELRCKSCDAIKGFSTHKKHMYNVYNIQSIYLVNIVLLKICRIPLSWLLHGMENLVTLLSNCEVCMNGNVCERKTVANCFAENSSSTFLAKCQPELHPKPHFWKCVVRKHRWTLRPRPIISDQFALVKYIFSSRISYR